MSQRSELIEYLRKNPKSTNSTLAKALGISTSRCASITTTLFKLGQLSRVEVGSTLSNVKIYGYSIPEQLPAPTKVENVVYVKENGSAKKSSLDSLVNQVAAQIAKSLASQVKRRLLVELEGMIPSLPPEPEVNVVELVAQPPKVQEKTAVITRLRKIGITGLLPQQAGLIMQEFGDTFDITFWNDRQGDGVAKLKSLGISNEVVFMHADHAAHKHDEVLKSVGAKVVIVRGGMTRLRDELTRYYVEEVAKD